MIDINTSRRDMFDLCQYWSQDNNADIVPYDQIVYNRRPTGEFYAKEENSLSVQNQVVAGTFMFEETTVTLKTNDDTKTLKRNDIVRYDNKYYRVETIQQIKIKKQRQFLRSNYSTTTYISLRG